MAKQKTENNLRVFFFLRKLFFFKLLYSFFCLTICIFCPNNIVFVLVIHIESRSNSSTILKKFLNLFSSITTAQRISDLEPYFRQNTLLFRWWDLPCPEPAMDWARNGVWSNSTKFKMLPILCYNYFLLGELRDRSSLKWHDVFLLTLSRFNIMTST